MRRIRTRGKLCCLLETFLMLITILFMTIGGGIHGEGLLRGAQLISLGFGLLEIMKLILFLKL